MRIGPDHKDEVARAWDIHKDADAIFYGQINAFLVAQAFLVAAFVAVFVAAGNEPRNVLLAAAVSLFGFLATSIWWGRLKNNLNRLWYLKHRYLLQMDAYQNYITANDLREGLPLVERQTRFKEKRPRLHPLADLLPAIVGTFWIIALVLDLSFFLIPGPVVK